MQITRIEIRNFRSIKNIYLDIEKISNKSCAIFLGVNESGKSNILKAIALLDDKRSATYSYVNDCNKAAKKSGEDIEVIYSFNFEQEFYKKQCTGLMDDDLIGKINFISIRKRVKINKDNQRKDYFEIELSDIEGIGDYIKNNAEGKIKRISDAYTGTEKLNPENIKQLLPKYEILDKDKLQNFILEKLTSVLKENTPQLVFWEPSEKYLINNSVDLNQFKDNPSLSIPLRNIFSIAKIENLKERIVLITNDIEERAQLAEELSERITKYVNKVWKEHKINIRIQIEQNLSCSVMVEDKDDSKPKYKMEQRSDGFKQFISILLNLSVENETELLKNKIIILDEPEVHLHPGGVRYLRDELLKISENNIVLISSHSIYMVDRKNLGRHYKVSKEKSLTSIQQIDKDNPYQEEVVYESLGTSIYELIEPNMIVFEGKTDKDIFDVFTKKFKSDFNPLNIGTMSADSADKVPLYTKFFNNKLVIGFFVFDSDQKGHDIKCNILKENPNLNEKNVFEINDIKDMKIKATLEDLLPEEIALNCVKSRYSVDLEIDSNLPIIEQIKQKLKDNRKIGPKDELKDLKSDIVNYVLNDIAKLTKEKTKKKYPIYYEFVGTLHQKIKSYNA